MSEIIALLFWFAFCFAALCFARRSVEEGREDMWFYWLIGFALTVSPILWKSFGG